MHTCTCTCTCTFMCIIQHIHVHVVAQHESLEGQSSTANSTWETTPAQCPAWPCL